MILSTFTRGTLDIWGFSSVFCLHILDSSSKDKCSRFFVSEQLPATQSLVREDVGCDTSQGDGREDGQAEVDQENVD